FRGRGQVLWRVSPARELLRAPPRTNAARQYKRDTNNSGSAGSAGDQPEHPRSQKVARARVNPAPASPTSEWPFPAQQQMLLRHPACVDGGPPARSTSKATSITLSAPHDRRVRRAVAERAAGTTNREPSSGSGALRTQGVLAE
ncbi:unnamed protein product, partial [Prorocentrum cordatum]